MDWGTICPIDRKEGEELMAWQTPKTNWQAADVVSKDDFNRIEGNIQHLQDTKETPAGAQSKVDAHNSQTSAHGATSSATANRIILRDASGRAKVAAPSASDDIATKGYVDSYVDSAISVGVSDTLALAYVPSEVQLRPYPTARLQFRLSCPGSLRISFMYRATQSGRYAYVYIYRIRGGTATILYYTKYYPDSYPNWAAASTDLSGWLVGDYLGLYGLDPDLEYCYSMVKDLYIKASPIVRTV